jgi:UDP-GlcNAc:undecaprenyl-phosphate GlcNAc-1-phosphate transferase
MVIVVFFLALCLNLFFIPLVRWVSQRMGRVAQPREDRWHRKPTATLGGVGIFAAFLVSLLPGFLLDSVWFQARWGILAGAGLVFLIGLYDDFRVMTPQAKLGGQILAATVVIVLGYTTQFFSPRIGNPIVAQLPNILLTYLWLVGITNAINLLDNMDGLAAGISLITAIILSYFFWRSGDQASLWISLALAGSLAGFLVYNFPPASIFMGDSGSLFLGFTLATLAIARQPQASNVFAVLGVPTLLFLLPILDTALVTFTRLLRGQSPVQGGRDHTSHRLIAFGLNERQAVLAMYIVALVSGVMAATLESIQYWYSLVLVPVLVLSLTLLMAYLGGLKVMPASTVGGSRGTLARIMLELTFKRRLLEVILDFFLICITYYLAFLACYGLVMDESLLNLYLQSLPLALAGAYVSFFAFGVYRGIWRYVGAADLVRYFWATLGSVVVVAVAVYIMNVTQLVPWVNKFSHMILGFFGLFLFLGFAATRSSFRIFDSFSQKRTGASRGDIFIERVLILGAGDAGEMALRWIWMNPQLGYRPVGFIDSDPMMKGRQIHGVEVLGSPENISMLLDHHPVEGLILATQDKEQQPVVDAIDTCQQRGCWVRSLRIEFEPVNVD